MHITWYGLSCVKIQTKEATVLVNPFQDSVGVKMPKLKVDIAATTDPTNDQTNNLERLQGEPVVLDCPGEYEIQEVFVYGVNRGAGKQSLFVIDAEGITVGHVGLLTSELNEQQLKKCKTIDVLLVPVTGLPAKNRAALISQIEPRIIIPVQYATKGMKEPLDSLDAFAKDMGVKDVSPESKLVLKKNDLPVDETQIIILEAA